VIEGIFGMPFERPLEHMREYVAIVKAGLHGGAVDFDGARLRAHAKVPNPAPVPVMISALRPNAFRLAGAIADGVLPWLCPAPYLRDVALPAIRAGAASANRRVPPLSRPRRGRPCRRRAVAQLSAPALLLRHARRRRLPRGAGG
jgi:alkanesulfonate monooxygenase SsuD/methylene tetrahydromethanopterin reductase-like flavin-dependent oxidoreductase (luciferase family)